MGGSVKVGGKSKVGIAGGGSSAPTNELLQENASVLLQENGSILLQE